MKAATVGMLKIGSILLNVQALKFNERLPNFEAISLPFTPQKTRFDMLDQSSEIKTFELRSKLMYPSKT